MMPCIWDRLRLMLRSDGMEKDIKDYREKELKSFVIGNILLILISSGLLDRIIAIVDETTAWTAINTILASAVFSSVIYIFVFMADSLIPGVIKDKIIWCCNGRPGEHIFADIKENLKDTRFTKKQALEQYAEIYKEIERSKDSRSIQNSSWYRIYKTHEAHAQISVSQRDFLLCRDMCILTPFITAGYLCLQRYRHQNFSCRMITILIVEFILLWFISRSKGKRFAYNVIAVDIAKSEKKDNKSGILVKQ